MQNDARAYLELLDAADEDRQKQLALLLEKRRHLRESVPPHPADDPAHRIHVPSSPKRHVRAAIAKAEDHIVDQERAVEATTGASSPGCAKRINPTEAGDLQANAVDDPSTSEQLSKELAARTAGEHARGAQAVENLSALQAAQRSKDETPQSSKIVDSPTRSYGLVVVSCSFRHLPSLSEKTKEVAGTLFNALVDPSFSRFAPRGSRLLVNPSVIEFQDTMKELQDICERDSSFFFFLSVCSKTLSALSGAVH